MLIHAGAGGVGSLAIQLAKARGAHVITTASTRNIPFVTKAGPTASGLHMGCEEQCSCLCSHVCVVHQTADLLRRSWALTRPLTTPSSALRRS